MADISTAGGLVHIVISPRFVRNSDVFFVLQNPYRSPGGSSIDRLKIGQGRCGVICTHAEVAVSMTVSAVRAAAAI